LQEWYSRSKLPFFLNLPSEELTYDVAIRALDYLQPENTIPMQVALYENIRRVHGYECDRTDVKSLKPVDRCLKNEFNLDAQRVVDRGMATWENLAYMDRKEKIRSGMECLHCRNKQKANKKEIWCHKEPYYERQQK